MGNSKLCQSLLILLLVAIFVSPLSHASECDSLTESTFTVRLPALPGYGQTDSLIIPNNRPIYALFVHGYSQNYKFDHLLFYNFAKHLREKNAYIHYAWWNNLCAEYMARPLHQSNSEPGNFITGIFGLFPNLNTDGTFRGKAIPAEDNQFQADAELFLKRIRENNPDAIIILVGHSMGGASVARLATKSDIVLDIVAPIDPVENRGAPVGRSLTQEYNWTRWRIARDEFKGYKVQDCLRWEWRWLPIPGFYCAECGGVGNEWVSLNDLPIPWSIEVVCGALLIPWIHSPPRREFGLNVINLHHRYQKESAFPFDYWADEHFDHIVPSGGSSTQKAVNTCVFGVDPVWGLCALGDGHQELVGYRGILSTGVVVTGWPFGPWAEWQDPAIRKQGLIDMRIVNDTWRYRPQEPDLCLVSQGLINLFDTMNVPPKADAGDDLSIECPGVIVTLDGSGSTDLDGDALTYLWEGPFGVLHGKIVTMAFDAGSYCVTLTVTDPSGHIDRDKLMISVMEAQTPISAFEAQPIEGASPLRVDFLDQSANNPTGWLWYFGDGDSSLIQNPSHIYNIDGDFTVTFITSNGCNSDTITMLDYIKVGVSTGVDDLNDKRIPTDYVLSQNHPNPFNPSTTIEYYLPNVSYVELTVHNLLGQRVVTLVNQTQQTGDHKIIWNGRDSNGNQVVSGVYLYRLEAGNFIESKKMLLLK